MVGRNFPFPCQKLKKCVQGYLHLERPQWPNYRRKAEGMIQARRMRPGTESVFPNLNTEEATPCLKTHAYTQKHVHMHAHTHHARTPLSE